MATPKEKNIKRMIGSICNTPRFIILTTGSALLAALLAFKSILPPIISAIYLALDDILVVTVHYFYLSYVDVAPPKDNASKTDKDPTDKQ